MTTFPDVLVMGRGTAERYQPGPGEVCISIRSPGQPFPDLSPGFADVLGLAFTDVCGPHSARVAAHTITDADAARVAAFVERYRDTAPRLVVHCEVGASRSVSLALALAYVYRLPMPDRLHSDGRREPITTHFPSAGFIPNRSVYVAVGRACRDALAALTPPTGPGRVYAPDAYVTPAAWYLTP